MADFSNGNNRAFEIKLGSLWDTHVKSLSLLYGEFDSLQELLDNSDGEQTKNLHT